MSLLHQTQLHQHDGPDLLRPPACANKAKKSNAAPWSTLRPAERVTQVPEPLPPSTGTAS